MFHSVSNYSTLILPTSNSFYPHFLPLSLTTPSSPPLSQQDSLAAEITQKYNGSIQTPCWICFHLAHMADLVIPAPLRSWVSTPARLFASEKANPRVMALAEDSDIRLPKALRGIHQTLETLQLPQGFNTDLSQSGLHLAHGASLCVTRLQESSASPVGALFLPVKLQSNSFTL